MLALTFAIQRPLVPAFLSRNVGDNKTVHLIWSPKSRLSRLAFQGEWKRKMVIHETSFLSIKYYGGCHIFMIVPDLYTIALISPWFWLPLLLCCVAPKRLGEKRASDKDGSVLEAQIVPAGDQDRSYQHRPLSLQRHKGAQAELPAILGTSHQQGKE